MGSRVSPPCNRHPSTLANHVATIESTIDIAAPTDKVWAIMTDIERWPDWTPTVSQAELLGGTDLTVGGRARLRQPKLPEAIWTVTIVKPLGYFEWQNTAFLVSSRSLATGLSQGGPGDSGPSYVQLEWPAGAVHSSDVRKVGKAIRRDRDSLTEGLV